MTVRLQLTTLAVSPSEPIRVSSEPPEATPMTRPYVLLIDFVCFTFQFPP